MSDATGTHAPQDQPDQPSRPDLREPGGEDELPTTVEEVVRAELLTALGGWRGTLEAAVPIIVFLAVWGITTELRPSVVGALVTTGVFVLLRVLQRQTLTHVLSGVFGVVIAAVVALRTGNAGDFFLPGILYNAALAVVFVLSMLARWPVVGLLFGAVTGDVGGWRHRPAVRRLFQRLTGVLLANYVIRVVVQLPLYLGGYVVALGAAKVVLGWPLLGVSVLVIGAMLAAGRTPLTDDERDALLARRAQLARKTAEAA